MNIEVQLEKYAGKVAKKLHTARSRNDQVALDLRLYIRDKVLQIIESLIKFQEAIIYNGSKNFDSIIPGYTHLQPAQPVLWPFYLLSYFHKFQRNLESVFELLKITNISPLGAGACSGTSLPIDPEYTARLLKFDKIFENGIDAVNDRSYLATAVYYLTLILLQLSSLAEDLIIYTTPVLNLVNFDEAIATSSSIMPQKKNLDIAELLRAKCGTAIGNLVSILTILKALPTSYNRDLQETKQRLIEQFNLCLECLNISKLLIYSIEPEPDDWADNPNIICATDIVEHLVKNGMPFRDAHQKVGACIRDAEGNLNRFIKIMQKRLNIKNALLHKLLTPRNSVRTKVTSSSTNPRQTNIALKKARTIIRKNLKRLSQAKKRYSLTELIK